MTDQQLGRLKSECEMKSPTIFFCRSRPQGCDAIDLVLREKRVFIGYPAWRVGKYEQDHDFRDAIIDLSSPDRELEALDPRVDVWRREISKNRNLVREVVSGAIVNHVGEM